MFNSKHINRNFGKASLTYDEHAQLQRIVREDCMNMAENCWRAGSRILDLGSGTGAFSLEAKERGLEWHITQMDMALGMCQKSIEHNPLAVNASAAAIPFADKSFDGVFSSLMLQWVYDPLPVMREIARVTKPESLCVISTLTQGTLQELRESFTAVDNNLHVNYFADPAPLTALCVHAGFKLMACEEETFTIDYPDVIALMRSLKAIGATTTQEARKGGLMTPRQLGRIESHYRQHFGKKKGLPATWQVLYMLLERN
jgi:malonyl-CoA O-methyltransferase